MQATRLTVKSSYSAAGCSVVCRYSSSWDTRSIRVLKTCMAAFALSKLFLGKGAGRTVNGACMVARGFSDSPAPTICKKQKFVKPGPCIHARGFSDSPAPKICKIIVSFVIIRMLSSESLCPSWVCTEAMKRFGKCRNLFCQKRLDNQQQRSLAIVISSFSSFLEHQVGSKARRLL